MPQWNRWRTVCDSCGKHGVHWNRPAGACGTCGGTVVVVLEEAILDLEVRSATVPRAFLDATVHHSVPGHAARLAAAALHPGAVNKEAEAASALLQRWGARLSCALHRANATRLRSALGTAELTKARADDLAAELAA